MKEREIKSLKNWVKKFLKDDSDKFDFNHEIDKSLSIDENKELLREKIKLFIDVFKKESISSKKNAEIMDKKEYQVNLEKQIEEIEEKAQKEFNKVLNQIQQNKSTEILDKFYFIPKQFIKMVGKKHTKGLLLYGEAGLGKTYNVMKALKEINKQFVVISGHITSMELYHLLFKHRKELIVLDDVNILENEKNLNLLKASLGNPSIVQYHSTSKNLKAPSNFLFEGQLIILLNSIPKKTESLKAVESRILNYKLKMDYKTKIKIIFELSKQEYKTLKDEDRQNIANWIKENTNEATENLNLRFLFNCYEFFLFDKDNWVKLAKKLIKNNEELILILNGLNEMEFIEKTGRHRATYYRLKRKLKNG